MRNVLRRAGLGLSCALGVLGPARAQAQTVTTVAFTAVAYVPQPLGVVAQQALQFGSVLRGAAKTVAAADASGRAATFQVTGAACAAVDVAFTLPATLAGPSAATLPIDTYTADAVPTTSSGVEQTAVASVTPGGTTVRLQLGRDAGYGACASGTTWDDDNGGLRLRIGATVRPAANQAAGLYGGTLQVSVAYVAF